jgi:hypothetical protein
MEALAGVLDPADVQWIWLTHPDRDHTGSLMALLEAAPNARLVTSFAAAGILSCEQPVPMNRVYFLNPGQSLDVGDRRLVALRPPLFDNPATVGSYDEGSDTYFASDCFGAPLPTAELATADDIGYAPDGDIRAAQLLWASVDSPWVHLVDEHKYLATLSTLRAMNPHRILSTHLPPAAGRTATYLDMLAAAPASDPFVGPDQAALEAMLAGFEPADVA